MKGYTPWCRQALPHDKLFDAVEYVGVDVSPARVTVASTGLEVFVRSWDVQECG